MLALRLNKNTENRLQYLATKTGRTKTYYAKEALQRYLESMEDFYLALDRLEDGTAEVISHDTVKKNLGYHG